MSYARHEIGDAFAGQLGAEPTGDQEGFAPGVWRNLAGGGWLELGDASQGLPFGEIASAVEAAGALRLAGPFAQTTLFALPLISRWFPELGAAVVSGEILPAVAAPGLDVRRGRLGARGLPVSSTEEGFAINGQLSGVPFAASATHLLAFFEDEERIPGLCVLELPAAGVEIEPEAVLDLAAPTATVRFTGAGVSHEMVVRDEELRESVLVALLRYLHGLTAESVGGMGSVLERTISYVSERVQFGVPVGSFQAVKHALADVGVAHELGRGLVYELAKRVDEDCVGAACDLLVARIATADAYLRACEVAIQCHGGAGFTWEQGLHHWYRAALRLRSSPLAVVDLRRVAAELVPLTLLESESPVQPQADVVA